MKIVLDPGHTAGYNKYPAPYSAVNEGAQMYILASYLAMQLRAKGYDVILTRDSVQDPSLLDRGADASGADLFISLHSNACESPSVDRVVVIPTITNKDPVYRAFCQDIGDTVKATIGISGSTQIYERSYTDNGKIKDYYGVIRNAVMYGCKRSLIIEHGFHTNLDVAKWLTSAMNLNKLAIAEAGEIAKYFPVPITVPSDRKPETNTYYGYDLKANVTVEMLRDILNKAKGVL